MFKNKSSDGKNNICGFKISQMRQELKPKVSQKGFADKLQLAGLDIGKNAVQQIESGERFVTDIELKIIAQVLNVSCDYLLEDLE